MSPRQLLALVWCALRAPVSSPFTPPRATAAAASRRAPRAASAPSDAELKVELTIDRWDGTEPWPSPPASRDDAGTPAAMTKFEYQCSGDCPGFIIQYSDGAGQTPH